MEGCCDFEMGKLGCAIMISIVVVDVVDVGVVLCDDFGYDSCMVCVYLVVLSCKGALIDIRLR